MEIRAARPDDVEEALQYEHLSRERLAYCIANGLEYVLAVEGRVVGVMRHNLLWQDLPFLELIYLDADFRGQGLGGEAMRFWEAEMRRQGYTHAMLSTQDDETAKFFYEKIDWQWRRQRRHCLGQAALPLDRPLRWPPGQEADELMYLKQL
jgi:GNAT superfamily N-acetyltransferase